MRTEQFFDLRIARFESTEDVPEEIHTDPGYDVIRVYEPTPIQRSSLIPLGYIYKPDWVFWLRPVCASEAEFLASLDKHARGLVRYSLRQVQARCRTTIEFTLTAEAYKRWLPLYQKRIAELPRGIDCATEDTDVFLSEPERFVGVFVYDKYEQDRLIAGAISVKIPERAMLRTTYYAGDSAYRHLDLTRCVYFTVCIAARELGYQLWAAGADPNFYGHDVSTGLYLLKKRMGLRAEPRQMHEPRGRAVLEKWTSLAKCEDVSFCMGYAGADPSPPELVGHVLTCQAEADSSPFVAPFLKNVDVRYLGDDAPP